MYQICNNFISHDSENVYIFKNANNSSAQYFNRRSLQKLLLLKNQIPSTVSLASNHFINRLVKFYQGKFGSETKLFPNVWDWYWV